MSELFDSILIFVTNHWLYSCIFISVAISYFVIKPVVYWFISTRSINTLSYFIASLLVVVIVLIISGFIQIEVMRELPKITLQSLALFGGSLWFIQVIKLLRNKVIKKRA